MATVGICAGYFTCDDSIHIACSIAWRLPFIIAAILAVALAISCLYLPESPRWLLYHNRRDEALRELKRLTLSRAEVEKDILTTAGRQDRSGVPWWHGLSAAFYRPHRARTGLGLFMLGMIQLCGIDGVLHVRLFLHPAKISGAGRPDHLLTIPTHSTHRSSSSKQVYQRGPHPSSHADSPRFLCLQSPYLRRSM